MENISNQNYEVLSEVCMIGNLTSKVNNHGFWLLAVFCNWEEERKKEWVGNSHKTIVLTACKDIDGFYCSQCCHIAECLCLPGV